MKIWIVCDNNVSQSIILFKSLKAAEKYIGRYEGYAADDCWLFDKKGTEVRN